MVEEERKKEVELLQGLQEVLHRERANFAHLPNEHIVARVQKDFLMSSSCSKSLEPSHSDVHAYVIVCSCHFKKDGGAGVS